jgi:DNA-binding MarR family transcriptional regulator
MRTISDAASADALAVATRIRRGTTTFAARARSERRGDLSLNEAAVLGQLTRHDAMTPGEIGRRLRAQPQSLTRTFASLEAHLLIRRVVDPADRRQSLLSVTDAGRGALRDEMQPRDAWVASVLERETTAAERAVLARAAELFERLAEIDVDLLARE